MKRVDLRHWGHFLLPSAAWAVGSLMQEAHYNLLFLYSSHSLLCILPVGWNEIIKRLHRLFCPRLHYSNYDAVPQINFLFGKMAAWHFITMPRVTQSSSTETAWVSRKLLLFIHLFIQKYQRELIMCLALGKDTKKNNIWSLSSKGGRHVNIGGKRDTQTVTAHRAPDVCSSRTSTQLPTSSCHLPAHRKDKKLGAPAPPWCLSCSHALSKHVFDTQAGEKGASWDEWWQPQLSCPFPFCTLNPNHGRRCQFEKKLWKGTCPQWSKQHGLEAGHDLESDSLGKRNQWSLRNPKQCTTFTSCTKWGQSALSTMTGNAQLKPGCANPTVCPEYLSQGLLYRFFRHGRPAQPFCLMGF